MDDFSMACLREVAELDRKLEHTRYWYSQRMDRLSKWAREQLSEQRKQEFFSIVANGTPDPFEPPTSAQNYNGMKERAERSESELVRLRAESGLEHVGWLTQAGNVVTPVGTREADARLYGWEPVYRRAAPASMEAGKK